MFHTADEFLKHYGRESQTTAKALGALTDASLNQAKAEGHNTLGCIAWHIATAPAYMAGQVGLDMPELGWSVPDGLTAAKIVDTYKEISEKVKTQMTTKTPEDMQKGWRVWDMDWTTATMLSAMISHEIHHRGQMSVLMRQAGLKVPSIYGPNHEETQEMMKQMQGGAK
jgi:uncharacterized damage-inducible protein DinB